MKRVSFLIAAILITFGMIAQNANKVTVRPSNPRMFSRFIYNYKSVLQDFNIKPDISTFVSTDSTRGYPAFIINGRDGHQYAVAAADMVVFANSVTVSIKDSICTISFADLNVVNVNEKLNLAAIRMPKDDYAGALEIDSIWFSDQDDNYSMTARMFLKSIPSDIAGDATTLSTLYNRMAEIATDGYSYILPNLSYKYLYTKSADQIADGIEALSDADYKTFQKMNAAGDVIGAMRILAGDMAAKKMKKNMQCTDTKVGQKETVLEGKDGEYITFVREFGAWRMASDQKPVAATTTNTAQYTTSNATTTTATATAVHSNSVIENDWVGTLVNFKVMVPYNFSTTGVGGSVSIGYSFKYVTFEAVFEYNSFTIDWSTKFIEHPTYANFFGAGLRIGAILPLRITDRFSIVPNIKFQWASPWNFSYGGGWINTFSPMGGLDFAWRIGQRDSRVFLGLQYEHKFIPYYNWIYTRNMGYFDFKLGFLF